MYVSYGGLAIRLYLFLILLEGHDVKLSHCFIKLDVVREHSPFLCDYIRGVVNDTWQMEYGCIVLIYIGNIVNGRIDVDFDVDAEREPRVQRPITSAHVARRMIANVLQDPDLRSANRIARAKELSSGQSRKARLEEKHKLREEAWGGD